MESSEKIKNYKPTASMNSRMEQTINAINNVTEALINNTNESNRLSRRIYWLTIVLTILTTISVAVLIVQFLQNNI